MRVILIIMISLFSLSLQACHYAAKRTDIAAKAYFKGKYRQSYLITREAAQKGNADAQYALGYMYYYGRGTLPNPREADRWFRAAALQGHVDAQRALRIINNLPQNRKIG